MIQVNAKVIQQVEISVKDLGHALMQMAWEKSGKIDDAGCDWLTDDKGNTYIADKDWKVSEYPIVAKMVDVGNFLVLGKSLKVDE